MNIYDLISRAQKLREETKIDSVSPERVGALCEDTLKYINEYQLLASSPALHKIYASVSAMQSDKSPKSDITGNALKPGQLVVIVPASQSDATAGNVYRYDGPSGNTSAWAFISKIGAVPADAQLNDTSANPVQNKVVTSVLTGISEDLQGVHQRLDGVEEDTGRCARDIESLRSRTTRLEIEMPNKANQSGKYPEMTAGFANNLVGRGEAVDAVIGFRASGGKSIADGAARVKELRGNSVVWNNKIDHQTDTKTFNGVTLAYNGNGTYKMTGQTTSRANFTITPDVYAAGHKFLVVGGKSATTYAVLVYYDSNRNYINISAYERGDGLICDIPNNVTYITLEIIAADSAGVSVDYTIMPLLVDLTQMFGQGNEPTSVADFYNRIPQNVDLYAYNEGEIISTDADGIKSVGFNAWDEEWEVGGLSQDGSLYNTSNSIRSKNYNRVLEGVEYCIKANDNAVFACIYDKDFRFLDFWSVAANAIRVFTMNQGAYWFKIGLPNNTTSVYTGGICINLSHSGYRNGEYQPYMQFIRNLDNRIKEAFPNGMKSAGTAHDKVYNKNGKGYIEKRIGMVDMGSLEWYADSGRFNSSVIADIGGDIAYRYLNVICRYTETMSGADKTFFVYENKQVFLHDSAYTDAVSLKAALKGVPLYYELATPEVIEYDEPFNVDYEVWDFGTEQILTSRPSAPIKASIVYGFNAVDSVRTAQLEIAELKTQIAQMQASMASMITQNVNVTTE